MTCSGAPKGMVLMLALASSPALAQRGQGNAQFQRYPFDKWATEDAKPQIAWSVRIDPPRLSPHQRLITGLHVTVAPDEIRKQKGNGPILVFARIEDPGGHRYQTGSQTPMARLHRGDRFLQLDYDVSAFVLPGEYVVSLAVCDGATLQHSFIRQRLHVAPIKPDPLPDSWSGLPAVEFLPDIGAPDSWYLPQVRYGIALPLAAEHPLRVELLVNTTPSELGSPASFRRSMELIVPALKVLTGLNSASEATSVGGTILDLNRRVQAYRQPDLRGADLRREWFELRPSFTELSAASIEAKTLAGQRKTLDFFSGEVDSLLGGHGSGGGEHDRAARVLIVLSAPAFFEHQEAPPLPDLPADPGRRVFFISYSPLASVVQADPASAARPLGQRPLYLFTDDIAHLLKPLGARVFRVSRPEEFRKALGAILDEIAKM